VLVVLLQDQYSFCYDVVDEIIAKKLNSMTTDSDSDGSHGTMDKKDNGSDMMKNHSPEINGSVLLNTAAISPASASPEIGHESGDENKGSPPSGV
jgi:hypothetical protein